MKKTICLDFDGVIHSYLSAWEGPTVIRDGPVEGAIAFMLEALSAGFRVSVLSARSRTGAGRRAMKAWLKKHAGNTWHESPDGPGLESVKFPRDKPSAVVSIDDHGYRFQGVFPPLSEINGLTWNSVAQGIHRARGGPPAPQVRGFA